MTEDTADGGDDERDHRGDEGDGTPFPRAFFWGTSSAAHQVEGGTDDNQWSKWERERPIPASGSACEHEQRYAEDVALMADLGYDAYRFSIEWSRIEPEPGRFDDAALAHYREMVERIRAAGLEPIPMLWHYTNPLWFMEAGGWTDADNVAYFERYVERVLGAIDADYWLTVDEPMVYAHRTCVDPEAPPARLEDGAWPDQDRSLEAMFTVGANLLCAHARAADLIHDRTDALVSLSKAVNPIYPGETPLDAWAADVRSYLEHGVWLESLARGVLQPPFPRVEIGDTLDFFGLNTFYSREGHFEADHPEPPYWTFETTTPADAEHNDLGWWVNPQGVYDAVRRVDRELDVPIVITSMGTAAPDDRRRRYICEHVRQIGRAIEAGADVRGLLYWSFMDNFEWNLGFDPRFGLVEVDYDTQERTPRESARLYGAIAEANGLTPEIEARYC
ncbi:MAG: glycoside hydrolase family 1 protein [Haloarculaceae archaeon]